MSSEHREVARILFGGQPVTSQRLIDSPKEERRFREVLIGLLKETTNHIVPVWTERRHVKYEYEGELLTVSVRIDRFTHDVFFPLVEAVNQRDNPELTVGIVVKPMEIVHRPQFDETFINCEVMIVNRIVEPAELVVE